MKLQIEREKLNRGLQIVSKVIATRPSLPILSNVLLTTESGSLRISGTDLELGITAVIPAQVENEGSFTLPARIFSEFIGSNTDSLIGLDINENSQAQLTSEKFSASISGMPADEFPNIPEVTGNLEITLNLPLLVKAFRQAVIACALDDIRPALAGVYMKFADKKLILAATDSFRLSEKIIPLEIDMPVKEMIIPARTAQEVIRIALLVPDVKSATIIVSESQVRVRLAGIDIISRLIEANFPDYEKIIPKESVFDLTVSCSELLTALKTSRIFLATGSSNIRLTIKDGAVTISSMTTERGQSKTQISAEIIKHGEDDELVVAYNARYLSDAIASIEDDKVVLFIAGSKKPTIVRNPQDANYQHLVMPVDIKE